MSSVNIRTVNGAKHNGQLHLHHQRIQNRAAAVLDAWNEFGESLPIDVVAHMHHIQVSQIKKDLYGDKIDFKKRFSTKSSLKFERALELCMKEIEEGINSALPAVAHNIPFMLIRDIQNSRNVKQVVTDFFRNIMTSNENESKENPEFTINAVHSTKKIFTPTTFSLIENQTITNHSTTSQFDADVVRSDFAEENVLFKEKRNISLTSTFINSSSLNKHNESDASRCCTIESRRLQETPLKRLKKLFHDTAPLTSSQLNMEWSITHVHDLGLNNTNAAKKCLNICYMNSIIQCLANAAPFVQWLMNDDLHRTCTLTTNDEFCSCCLLRLIIKNIHRNFHNSCDSFSELSQASAVPSKQNYESIWSISINSYFNLQQGLDTFCSVEELAGDDMFFCSKCRTKVLALQSTKLIDASPVIFIRLKRFVYDKKVKVVRKIKQLISYPELLDLSSFITSEALQSNKENHKFNEFIYQLNAVVVHFGETVDSSHIFSYIRSLDHLWYKADDASITKTNLNNVLDDNDAYILCYSKLAKNEVILRQTEVYTACKESSRLLFSSTPIRPDDRAYTNIEDRTTTRANVLLNISGSVEDDSSKQDEPIEFQTESQIEFISNMDRNEKYPSNWISSDTPNSPLTSQSQNIPSQQKKRVLFNNDSVKLSINSIQSQPCSNSNINIGSPPNISIEDSQDDNNFNIQLPSSYQFKLQLVDLVKLKSIRTTKINKKTARVFKAMGLSSEVDDKSPKQIFFSKQAKTTSSMVDKVADTPGIPFDSSQQKQKQSRVDM
ncbi:unnamed protein product [Rotaria sordida]|uniref:Ubiquitin carboxyl-terminal hydrolase 36 n=1 Tax=Rotaria sordida TaxID=392033 RepID=A0A815H594_9BILA|nr:unnamed protein product [Rotaria sordida]CAF1347225.1 unnamed protein product [Rotaria sordida]